MIEYGARGRTLPAPPHVVWDDLVSPRQAGARAWLDLRSDEIPPTVVESERPTLVVWSSLWPGRPGDRVVMHLGTKGADTLLHFTLLADGEAPDAATVGHIRLRINTLLWADLRYSYGQ